MKSALKRCFLIMLCLILNICTNFNSMITFYGNICLFIINLIMFIIKDLENKKFIKSAIYGGVCLIALIISFILKITEITSIICFINIFIFIFELADYMKLKNPKSFEIIFISILSLIVIGSVTVYSELKENKELQMEKELINSLEKINSTKLLKQELMDKIEDIIEKDLKTLKKERYFIEAGDLETIPENKKTQEIKSKEKLEDLLINLEKNNVNLAESNKDIKDCILTLNASIENHKSKIVNTIVFVLFEILEIILLFLKSDELKFRSNAII